MGGHVLNKLYSDANAEIARIKEKLSKVADETVRAELLEDMETLATAVGKLWYASERAYESRGRVYEQDDEMAYMY